MMTESTLRNEVKSLKAFSNVNYNSIANCLDVKISSFYSWLRGNYSFSYER